MTVVVDELVGAIAVLEHVRIVVGQAQQHIVSGAALDRVLARRPDDHVVAVTADQRIRFRDRDLPGSTLSSFSSR